MPRLGRLPNDIPAAPNQVYGDKGWKGIGDWLGTGTVAARLKKYRPFLEARAFVRTLQLKSSSEWVAFARGRMLRVGQLPAAIPATPAGTYANKGWKGMGDWLGTGTVAPNLRKYRPFREARLFVRNLKLKSTTEWRAFYKGEIPRLGRPPNDIPAAPDQVYADKGWTTWGEWLGTGRVADQLKVYRPFLEARAFVRALQLNGTGEWRAFCNCKLPRLGRLPADIPAAPWCTYADRGWKGMGDWLGNERARKAKNRNRTEAHSN